MDELIQQIMSSVGVNQGQAKGGAGLIFNLVREQLSSGDFSKLSSLLPGADKLADEAPSGGGGGGGLMGALGGLAGGAGLGPLGDLAGLAGGFSKLGLDAGDVAKFLPIVLSFAQNKGGDEAKELIEKAVK